MTSKLMTRSSWGCEDEVMGNLVWNCLDCCNHLHFYLLNISSLFSCCLDLA